MDDNDYDSDQDKFSIAPIQIKNNDDANFGVDDALMLKGKFRVLYRKFKSLYNSMT